MKKFKSTLRLITFVLLLLLALAGIGLPIPFFHRDRFDGKFKKELLEEKEEQEDSHEKKLL